MAFGDRITPGTVLWTLTTPVTTAASPVTSPWINTDGFTQMYVIAVAAGGVSALALEWGFDGAMVDTDITATTVTVALTVTPRDALAPYTRLKWTQTSANATVSKLTIRAK
jgi:hypothetical protein